QRPHCHCIWRSAVLVPAIPQFCPRLGNAPECGGDSPSHNERSSTPFCQVERQTSRSRREQAVEGVIAVYRMCATAYGCSDWSGCKRCRISSTPIPLSASLRQRPIFSRLSFGSYL